MMKTTVNESYECKDLMLSAAILSSDVPLLGIQRTGKFFTFIFDDKEKCQKTEEEWWSGRLVVVATKYADSIKRLKGLIYSQPT